MPIKVLLHEIVDFGLRMRAESRFGARGRLDLGHSGASAWPSSLGACGAKSRDLILRACEELPELAGITWLFPKVPGWPLKQAIEPEWERTYNFLWQVSATMAA